MMAPLMFLVVALFRDNLEEGFILSMLSVFLSVMMGRASGAGQGSPVSRKQGAKLAVFSFPFLIQAIAQPVERGDFFHIYRNTFKMVDFAHLLSIFKST